MCGVMEQYSWVEGNFSSKARCSVCNKHCASKHSLFGYKCSWCARTVRLIQMSYVDALILCDVQVHPKCLASVGEGCDLGAFCSLILPPRALTVV